MPRPLLAGLRRLFFTPYAPDPHDDSYLARALVQESSTAEVILVPLDAAESHRIFGVPLMRKGIQPFFLKIVNRSTAPLRLQFLRFDPKYYTPLEAAAANHFSIAKRLGAFGLLAWVFLPLLVLLPFKLVSARSANRRMDDLFRSLAFHLHPIPPGAQSAGFIFTPLDLGARIIHVCLHSASPIPNGGEGFSAADLEAPSDAEFTFSVPTAGIAADHLRKDLVAREAAGPHVDCDVAALAEKLRQMPPATTNARGNRSGDPVNLIVIGDFETLLTAFGPRWDESETITLATCWKTARAFLLGIEYRYSPVSPLYLFGRSQDVALQRARQSINERLHLRLWLTELRFRGLPVYVGQVSRDIGVRFTSKTWNLTTHRVDPDVDEARDYVVEDLLQAERTEAAGYIDGVGACNPASPRCNLTGDPYFTDGKRASILLSRARTKPRFVAWR